MTEFSIRSDAVDVEQIMRQIRTRIREKRGVDYTEDEIRELASVKLETFLDPRSVRSDLVEHYRRRRERLEKAAPPGNYTFESWTPYESSRGLTGRLIGLLRRALNPVLKLFINPNPFIVALNLQSRINEYHLRSLAEHEEFDALRFEVLNNLVVEITRLGIEVRNLKMRAESLSSRLDFDERRARALEGVVEYRTGVPAATGPGPGGAAPAAGGSAEAEASAARRRRRRRGRRRAGAPPGPAAAGSESAGTAPPAGANAATEPEPAVGPAPDRGPDES